MKNLTLPLVGAHFRPPAKQILAHLPGGTPLILWPEPTNPYDHKAIKVLCQLQSTLPILQYPLLETALEGTGFDLMELLRSPDLIHLGYLPNSNGKLGAEGGNAEAAALAADNNLEVCDLQATLHFNLEDKPMVYIAAQPAAQANDGAGQ